MILPDHKRNFETLQRASRNGDLALMECVDSATQTPVTVICAVQRNDVGIEPEFEFIPLAKLFSGNPYKELIPPL